jgi:NADH:ubiquinone oxidoreductase subunit 3 (subunit A)
MTLEAILITRPIPLTTACTHDKLPPVIRPINRYKFIAGIGQETKFLIPLGILLPAVAIGLNRILAPRKPNAIKDSTYECGIETVGDTWVQLKGQYYIFALIFLVFDIEAVFLFPWAVAYEKLQLYMVLEGVLFILILAGGLLYAWRRGALEWV